MTPTRLWSLRRPAQASQSSTCRTTQRRPRWPPVGGRHHQVLSRYAPERFAPTRTGRAERRARYWTVAMVKFRIVESLMKTVN